MDKVYAETTDNRLNWLYSTSGVAALIVGVLLLIALISLVAAGFPIGAANDWLSRLQNNWLVVLFTFNVGIDGAQFDQLYGLNPLDTAILALVALLYLGLYAALRQKSVIWSTIAVVQPFLGIMIFLVTRSAGRSAVMGAGLVISFLMLRSNVFGKLVAIIGILASVLLLIGDFSTMADSHSIFIGYLIGIGYLLLMTWFFLVSRSLFKLMHEMNFV